MNDRIMSIKDVCEHFEVSHVTVQAWKKRGCPFTKIFAKNNLKYRIMFKLSEVENWISEQQKKRG